MSSGKALALKRINKDIKEIMNSPVEGIGIVSLDNNPMEYIVNMQLMTGIYKGYRIQLLLTFSDNYPTKPPKILIYPNQGIDGQYHHHIFPDTKIDENGKKFKKFCFDLLDNDFMSTSVEHSGWNPSYSICSLLLQVQNFLCDPDMPQNHLPNKEKIDQLMKSMDTYQRVFNIMNDNNKMEKIIHTWEKPYPEIFFREKEKEKENKIINNNKKIDQLKENLTCFMLKLNYIDDPYILLGYPIVQKKIGYVNQKIELYPIPELLTYDGYMAQIGKQDSKLDFYFNTNFKSANNEFYNYWIPIYIDEKHYKKNRTTILNSFSVIKYGPRGLEEYDFKPEQIFEILPIILNKMIIGMFNGKSVISTAFIRCYFQYVLLFKKLCLEFEKEYLEYLNHKLSLIAKKKYRIDKSLIPDIGNFFMLLFFCNKDTHTPKMKKMWYCLFEEFFTRQMYWMFHGNENRIEMRNRIIQKCINNDYLKKYYSDKPKIFNDFKTELINEFNQELNKSGIYEEIIDIICTDNDILFSFNWANKFSKNKNQSNTNDIKTIVKEAMSKNISKICECSDEGKTKIFQKMISNMNVAKYFNIDIQDFSHEIELYESFRVDTLLKKLKKANIDDIMEFCYKSQRGNSLLLITFFALKKIEEKGFMEELEKNYGIYLDVDNFIKEMKDKLNEIKSFSGLFEYIGSEFGKNTNDIDLIIQGYERATRKGYIK